MGIQCFLVELTKEETTTAWCEECQENHTESTHTYTRLDTGETNGWPGAFGPGAMWFEALVMTHEGVQYKGNGQWNNDDGRHLFVVLPNGHCWDVDSRCSNCGSPEDRCHRCWVRHGEPPNVTVDKNGYTCCAGAGSIWSAQGSPNEWHGFLRNGILEQC